MVENDCRISTIYYTVILVQDGKESKRLFLLIHFLIDMIYLLNGYIIFSHSICKYPSFGEHWYSYGIRYLFIVYCVFGWTMDEKCVLCGCHDLLHYIVREPKTLPPNTTSRVLTFQAFISILYQILKNDCTPRSWMRECIFSWPWCSGIYTLQFAPIVIKG